jgi:HD-GYP domain-containing protein (c-di-GMP phosphodiesterase class II)
MHFRTKDGNFFAIINKLENNKSYLGITIDSDKLLKPYNESLQYSIYIALILIFASIIIILISTNFIIRPIKRLILENEKIKNRHFNEVKEIQTNIIEFRDLSHSLLNMSKSIQEYQKAQEQMLDSIIKLIAEAIDAKSPYTGGHCERVPEIAKLLLNEVNNSDKEEFKSFHLTSKDALREFEIGAWLHDCGKVTTPEYVVDKSSKLETIYNRIHEIRMRFEVLWRDAQLEYMSKILDNQDKISAQKALHVKQNRLIDDYNFIASVNIGGEYMDESKQQRVKEIASIQWQRHFDDRIGLGEAEMLRYKDEPIEELPVTENLLADKKIHIIKRENFDYEGYKKDGFKEDVPEYLYNYGEIYNLCIAKGTLSAEERYKINEHVIMSIKMLEKIPFPSHLKNIPEYAGTHHETLIGTGYPRKFTKEELSIPARIMAIADIFEALSASDRPYKKAKTLSQSLKIMSFMAKDQHIDKELFELFLESGVYKQYAQKYLKNEQIDEVDIKTLMHL